MPMTGRVGHDDIQEWYEAWNRRDWEAVAGLLSSSVLIEDIALGKAVYGTKDYLHYARQWARIFPDGRLKIDRLSGSGNRGEPMIVEYSCEGTQLGPWGIFEPSPRKTVIRFCDILRFKYDRIATCTTYGDYYRALRDLGHLPMPGGDKKLEAA